MKLLISTSAPGSPQMRKIAKLKDVVLKLSTQLSEAKKALAEAQKVVTAQKVAVKKTNDAATVKSKGKVSFVVKSATGRSATFTKFGEALTALTKSGWGNGKSSTLKAITKASEELLATKTQKRGVDKPLPAVYLTAKGRTYKNAA